MKIKLISIEDGIVCYGFRRIVTFTENFNADTHCYYVATNLHKKWTSTLFNIRGDRLRDDELDAIATELSDADVVGFSSMTAYSDQTKALIARVKEKSKHTFIVWGGIHPIVFPDDAIKSNADAICVGEGEYSFRELIKAMEANEEYKGILNFWFKDGDRIIKNGFRPLMSCEERDKLPFPKYRGKERIFKRNLGFVQSDQGDYLNSGGLTYPTLWTIGCPFRCAYCSNSTFSKNDPAYKKIRYQSPRKIVDEVKRARAFHPWISSVSFFDDSFMALPTTTLREFAAIWNEEVGLPFAVYGVIPTYVSEEKFQILTEAGMNRIRMGIQSGSQRLLDFYRRPASIAKVEKAVAIISKFKKYHIPPSYDLIVDNPIETRQDVIDTLELVYRMPRPYTLNIYSLRIFPNTELESGSSTRRVEFDFIDYNSDCAIAQDLQGEVTAYECE